MPEAGNAQGLKSGTLGAGKPARRQPLCVPVCLSFCLFPLGPPRFPSLLLSVHLPPVSPQLKQPALLGTLILRPTLTFLRGNMNDQLGWVSTYTWANLMGGSDIDMAVWMAEALRKGGCRLVCLAGLLRGVQWLVPRNLHKVAQKPTAPGDHGRREAAPQRLGDPCGTIHLSR